MQLDAIIATLFAGAEAYLDGPSEASRGSTVKSWEDVAYTDGSPKPTYLV